VKTQKVFNGRKRLSAVLTGDCGKKSYMLMKNKKREYMKATVEVIIFSNEDILTKSGNCGHKTSGNNGNCNNKGHECNQNNGNH